MSAFTHLEQFGYTSDNGLVMCDEQKKEHHAEWYHIENVAKKLKVDAVLFRRTYQNKKLVNSRPVVYIFNNEALFQSDEATVLHSKLWSAGEIDVYIKQGKTQLEIINARRPAELKKQHLNIDSLKLYADAINGFNDYRFSAHIFAKGLFWEQDEFQNKKDKQFYQNQLDEKKYSFSSTL